MPVDLLYHKDSEILRPLVPNSSPFWAESAISLFTTLAAKLVKVPARENLITAVFPVLTEMSLI